MAIIVTLKTQRGIITNRRFNLGEGVSVYGSVYGVTGMFEPGTHIRFELLDSNNQSLIYKDTVSDIWGNYDFWFRTPDYETNLKIKLTATYSISGQDIVTIPISTGNRMPDKLPDVSPEKTLLDWLPIVAIAAVGFYAYKVLKS